MVVPELPATQLADNCYDSMFYGCTSLAKIKCLATRNISAGCTSRWLTNTAATGTFIKAKGANWESGDSGIPNGWNVQEV